MRESRADFRAASRGSEEVSHASYRLQRGPTRPSGRPCGTSSRLRSYRSYPEWYDAGVVPARVSTTSLAGLGLFGIEGARRSTGGAGIEVLSSTTRSSPEELAPGRRELRRLQRAYRTVPALTCSSSRPDAQKERWLPAVHGTGDMMFANRDGPSPGTGSDLGRACGPRPSCRKERQPLRGSTGPRRSSPAACTPTG